MPAKIFNKKSLKRLKDFFIYLVVLIIIVLSAVNIKGYLTPKTVKVLGASTEKGDPSFWQEFLAKNPTYIPGWLEIGRVDKAKDIDPNYLFK